MCRITGSPDCDIVSVDSGYSTPPALEGRSCLYVLRYAAFVRGAGWVMPPMASTAPSAAPSAAAGEASGADDGGETVKAGGEEDGDIFLEAFPGREVVDEGTVTTGEMAKEAGVWFYVGESDSIRERLRKHGRKWGGGAGSGSGLSSSKSGGTCKLDAIVVPAENRSEARRLETAVIRAMKGEGFHLVSDKDGSRKHFSSATAAAGPSS